MNYGLKLNRICSGIIPLDEILYKQKYNRAGSIGLIIKYVIKLKMIYQVQLYIGLLFLSNYMTEIKLVGQSNITV